MDMLLELLEDKLWHVFDPVGGQARLYSAITRPDQLADRNKRSCGRGCPFQILKQEFEDMDRSPALISARGFPIAIGPGLQMDEIGLDIGSREVMKITSRGMGRTVPIEKQPEMNEAISAGAQRATRDRKAQILFDKRTKLRRNLCEIEQVCTLMRLIPDPGEMANIPNIFRQFGFYRIKRGCRC